MSRIWVGVHSSLSDVEMSKNITAANVQLKRAYERPARGDGTRILIDRLWPRGMTKKAAAIDEWFKDIAPSTALRQWFGHDPARWQEFRRRYAVEVRQNPNQLASYAPWHGKVRSRSCSRPMTRFITTPSSFGTCCWEGA